MDFSICAVVTRGAEFPKGLLFLPRLLCACFCYGEKFGGVEEAERKGAFAFFTLSALREFPKVNYENYSCSLAKQNYPFSEGRKSARVAS